MSTDTAAKPLVISNDLIAKCTIELARRTIDNLKRSPTEFRNSLLIDADGEVKVMGPSLADWQKKDFDALENAWKRICGFYSGPCKSRAYLERPKGHSKTTDEAVMALWALFASPKKIRGIGAAAAQKQAKLLRDAIDTILRLNPWLSDDIQINNFEVKNKKTGSILEILASCEASSHGGTPDFVICDELTHWELQGFWTSIFASISKRKNCVMVVIANAGYKKGETAKPGDRHEDIGGGWHWYTREMARIDPQWYFHSLPGPVAYWITEENLAEQRRWLSKNDFARLWLNVWLTDGGEILPMEEVEACVTFKRSIDNPAQHLLGLNGMILGLDLALNRHHAAMVAIGINTAQRKLRLCESMRWKPADFPEGRISLTFVENQVLDYMRMAAQHVGEVGIAYDPFQCERSAEEFVKQGFPAFRQPFVSTEATIMAECLLRVFREKTIELYRDPLLFHDLPRVSIISKNLGMKIEGFEDETGHCDTAIAFSIALPWALGTLEDDIMNGR